MPTTAEVAAAYDRMMARTVRDGRCLLFTGAKDRDGYGAVRVGKQVWRAPRLAWLARHGDLPPGRHVLHHCDRPACLSEACLFLGDAAINNADCIAKGRARRADQRGEANHRTRLSEDDVTTIRRRYAEGESPASLAAEYGLGRSTVRNIVRRRRWAHVA